MTVLAIDPGPEQSAFLQWDSRSITAAHIFPNAEVRHYIGRCAYLSKNCVIEMIAHYGTGMPAGKEIFDTCVWIGRFAETWERATGVDVQLIERRHIKLHHCRSARAKDANIRQALIDKYGKPGTKRDKGVTYELKSHLWSCFALATYVTETRKEAA